MKTNRSFARAALAVALACSGGAFAQESSVRPDACDLDYLAVNVMPYSPGNEARAAADAVRYAERTGDDIVLYSLTLHPEGRPATNKLMKCMASYRAFARSLAGTRVRPGILIQAVLGHWPRVDKDEEPWTRSVDITGAKVRYCPADPDFKAYIFRLAQEVARAKPAFVLTDDDLRAYSHEAECFCDRHVAELNRRLGTSYTPDEAREAVRACAVGDRTYEAFIALQREMIDDVAKTVRAGFDSVDPTLACGSSMPGEEPRWAARTARLVAAKGQTPIVRVCNSYYMEKSPNGMYGNVVVDTFAKAALCGGDVRIIEEADTFPHTLWSKSAVSFFSKGAISAFCGFSGAKRWLVGAHKADGTAVDDAYTAILERHRGYLAAVTRAVGGTTLGGVAVPLSTHFNAWHPATNHSELGVGYVNAVEMGIGPYGFPFYATESLDEDCVYALAGAGQVARFTDAELQRLLAGRLLVDGGAAAALVARGFADLIGVTGEMRDFRYNGEQTADGASLTFGKCAGTPFLTARPGAEVLSRLVYRAFAGATPEEVSVGASFFRNRLGGRVVVTAFHTGVPGWHLLNAGRKGQLANLLSRLGFDEARVANNQFVLTLTRRAKDGSRLVSVTNLGYDPLEPLELTPPAGMRADAILANDGTWATYRPPRLAVHETALLRLGYGQVASFAGAHATLAFDAGGALSSIREKASGRELVGERCPFMDVTLADGRVASATALVRAENGNLVFSFEGVSGEAEIRLVPFAGGWTIETVRFDVKDAKTWTIAHVKPGCKRWYGDMACLVSDEQSGVVLRPYEPLLRTACDKIPNRAAHSLYGPPDAAACPTAEQIASGLMIRVDAPDAFVGRRCGLAAGPRDCLRDMLKAMTRAADVPWSAAGGAWALDAPCNRGSYLFTTCMNKGSAADWIEMMELGGFTTAHAIAWWEHYGLYAISKTFFPGGMDELVANFRAFREAGYRTDLHHLSHCILYAEPCFVPEVTVDPDDLIERCTYTLARPFAPGDTELYVNEQPWDGHDVQMKSHSNGNVLLVGRELVQYHALSREKPYCFSQISRGSFKTQFYGVLPIKVSAETFPVGTKVKYPQQRYASFFPKPGSKLMEQVSDRVASIFNACEANGVYFDGAEGMMTVYGTEKGRETTFRRFKGADEGIICESACLYPYSWWYRSRIGPWDHAEWGAKRFVDEHIRSLYEYATKANLLRVNLGWWGPMMGCPMARQHFSDEMEYNGCKGAAIDAADGFQLPDPFGSVNTNSVHFHTEDQLAIFGWWERARMARALTDSVLEKIRKPGAEFRLRQDETGLWRVAPQLVTAHAVKDRPYAAWTVGEPESRRADLRVEALYGAAEYDGPQAKSILAPKDAPVLEKQTAPGVELKVSTQECTRDQLPSALYPLPSSTLVLEATNANAFRDGAWARVGKRYPYPYLAVDKALGLWVKGDGSGALLNVQIEQAVSCYHACSEHYVRLDFTGWRYFALQLRERDAYEHFNHKWPYSHNRLNTATEVYRTEIFGQTVEYVNLYLNDIPAGGKTRVEVSDIRTMPRREMVFRRGVVTLNGEDFPVPFEMKSTDVAECVDGVWTLLGDAGEPIARKPAAKRPEVRSGANGLAWRAETADGAYPRVEVTVLAVGAGEPAFRSDAIPSQHLAVEAERPLVHRPADGLVARTTVRTRPGETAGLEFRILGPIDTPALTVGGVTHAFPVKLANANEVLRCKDGRNWTVTRVAGQERPVLAKGTLPKAIAPLAGATAVSLSSADETKVSARLSIVKRYGTKGEGER